MTTEYRHSIMGLYNKCEVTGMLDEEDLQAIAQIMLQQKGEITQAMLQQREEIIHEVGVLMESYFEPKFNLLAEGQQMIREQMVKKDELEERLEEDEFDISLLKGACRKNTQEIEKLKKAL